MLISTKRQTRKGDGPRNAVPEELARLARKGVARELLGIDGIAQGIIDSDMPGVHKEVLLAMAAKHVNNARKRIDELVSTYKPYRRLGNPEAQE